MLLRPLRFAKITSLSIVFSLAVSIASQSLSLANQSLFEQAKQEIESSSIKESTLAQLQEFVQANPKNSDGRLYLGLALEAMGLREQANEQLKLSVNYGPQNEKALVDFCKQQISQGHVTAAMELLKEGLKKFPKNAEILRIVGDYLIKQKRPVEARSLLERAFMLDSSLFGLPTSLAQIYMKLDPARAIKYATLDLDKKPEYKRALKVRGVAYTILKQYPKAARDLEPVFENDPTLTPIAQALSESFFWLGNYEKALKPAVFLLAFSSKPDIDNYYPTKWMVKVMKPIPKEKALILVNKYQGQIAQKFNIPAFYYFLGTIYDQLNYRDEAISNYKETIKRAPEYVMAHYRLGIDLELYKKDHEAALKHLTRAHNLRPWDNEINLAYLRLQDRMFNKDRDISLSIKKWLSGLGSKTKSK